MCSTSRGRCVSGSLHVVVAALAGLVLAAAAPAEVTLVAVENAGVHDNESRAFDIVVGNLASNQKFVEAELIGTSVNSDFRNQDAIFDVAHPFNIVDSWMTAPRFPPNIPTITALWLDPSNSFTQHEIYWHWKDLADQAIPGLNGIIARIMLEYGGHGILEFTIGGTFSDKPGFWQESFTLSIGVEPPPPALVALERPNITAPDSRAFDLVLSNLSANEQFVGAHILGASPNAGFRNPNTNLDVPRIVNRNADSWMTAPWYIPNTDVAPITLITDPDNLFTSTEIDWAWEESDAGQLIPGQGGVIARIMLAEGGEGMLQITVHGTFSDSNDEWSEVYSLPIPPPPPVLEVVEKPQFNDGTSRAFDLVLGNLAQHQTFAAAAILGLSPTGAFRNQDPIFDFARTGANVDSWMTSPRFFPNTNASATGLILAPTNYFSSSTMDWAWADNPDLAIMGQGGVIARIMVANGRAGTIDVMLAGTFDSGGSWDRAYAFQLGTDDPNLPAITLEPQITCGDVGDRLYVNVELDRTNGREVLGGQFFLRFDRSRLTFVGAVPGGTGDPANPFDVELVESVNPTLGTLDYAVGVNPGEPGTSQPATMAVLEFALNSFLTDATDLVLVRLHDPPTRLTLSDAGGGVEVVEPLVTNVYAVVFDTTPPQITPPPDITVFADAGTCAAVLSAGEIGLPVVTDNCTDPGDIALTFARSDGRPNLTDPFDSADSPVEIVWTAMDESGNVSSASQFVSVEPFNVVSIDFQLQPFFDDPNPDTPGDLVRRCVEFEFTAAGGVGHTIADVLALSADTTNDPAVNGRTPAPVMVLVPCGDYDCVTARESLHSLRTTLPRNDSALGFRIADTLYEVDFTSPDRWLLQGNLLDVAGEDVIDILDFGVLVQEFRRDYGSRDTDCTTPAPHADVDGDAIVGIEDFTFIAANFLAAGDMPCSPGQGGGGLGRASVTLEQLEALGLGHLRSADLNRDGVIDAQDVTALLEQEQRRPQPNADGPRARPGRTDEWDRRVP